MFLITSSKKKVQSAIPLIVFFFFLVWECYYTALLGSLPKKFGSCSLIYQPRDTHQPKATCLPFYPCFPCERGGQRADVWDVERSEAGGVFKIKMMEGVGEASRQGALGTLTPNILFPLHVAAENSFTTCIYFFGIQSGKRVYGTSELDVFLGVGLILRWGFRCWSSLIYQL